MIENGFDSDVCRDLFRDIDIAFASMLARLSPEAPSGVVLAALLTSRASGEGHVCVDLKQWAGHELLLGNGNPTGLHCPSFDEWMVQLQQSSLVGDSGGECHPLICDTKGRVYLQRLFKHEQHLAGLLRRKADAPCSRLSATEEGHIVSLLDRYFNRSGNDTSPDWQKIAAVVAILKRLCIISGAPGTGKTTTVAKILAVLLACDPLSALRIRLCAPTGKAAARLGASITKVCREMDFPEPIAAALTAVEAGTIHRLLRALPRGRGFVYNETNPLPADVVVVDEASMVDLVLMSRLVRAVPNQARLIILGDKDQLASVDAGSVFGDLCRGTSAGRYSSEMRRLISRLSRTPHLPSETGDGPTSGRKNCTVVLQENYRYCADEGIGALARAVNAGDAERVRHAFENNQGQTMRWDRWRHRTEFDKLLAAYARKGYETYLASRDPEEALSRFNRFRILSALASGPFGVDRLNRFITDVLAKDGLVGRERPWYPGRPVMITRNHYRLGLYNGDTGLAWPDGDGNLKIWFPVEGGGVKGYSPRQLPEHQTAFALTVHKSQGSEFDQTLLILPDRDSPVLSRELIYTGCTRARHQLILMAPDPIVEQAVNRTIRRTTGLVDALDADE